MKKWQGEKTRTPWQDGGDNSIVQTFQGLRLAAEGPPAACARACCPLTLSKSRATSSGARLGDGGQEGHVNTLL